MIGAIAGDVIGSVHESAATKTKRFPLFTPESCFTDDTVLMAAAILFLESSTSLSGRRRQAFPLAGTRRATTRQVESQGQPTASPSNLTAIWLLLFGGLDGLDFEIQLPSGEVAQNGADIEPAR